MIYYKHRCSIKNRDKICLCQWQKFIFCTQKMENWILQQNKKSQTGYACHNTNPKHFMETIIGFFHIGSAQLLAHKYATTHPQRNAQKSIKQKNRGGKICHSQPIAAHQIAHQQCINQGANGDGKTGAYPPKKEIQKRTFHKSSFLRIMGGLSKKTMCIRLIQWSKYLQSLSLQRPP